MSPFCALSTEEAAALPTRPSAELRAEAPVSRDAIADDVEGYYAGELFSAVFIGGLGLASTGVGAYLVTRDTDFARGYGWPLLTLGTLEAIGGVAYGLSVRGEIEHYGAMFAADPARFRAEEKAHIHGTNSRFVVYRTIEFVMAGAGAGMLVYGLAANRDAWKGAGAATLTVALPILVLDTFNSARAVRYEQRLDRFDPALAIGPGFVGVRGRF
jgi:hypothetical protein